MDENEIRYADCKEKTDENIKNGIYKLDYLTDADGLMFPESVNGDINLKGLKYA